MVATRPLGAFQRTRVLSSGDSVGKIAYSRGIEKNVLLAPLRRPGLGVAFHGDHSPVKIGRWDFPVRFVRS